MSTEKVNTEELCDLWLVGAYDLSASAVKEEFYKNYEKYIRSLTDDFSDKFDLHDASAFIPIVENTLQFVTYDLFPGTALNAYGNPFILVKDNGEEITVNSDNANEVLPSAVIEKMNITLEQWAVNLANLIMEYQFPNNYNGLMEARKIMNNNLSKEVNSIGNDNGIEMGM